MQGDRPAGRRAGRLPLVERCRRVPRLRAAKGDRRALPAAPGASVTAKPQPRITARDLVAALERRVPRPEYVLLEQVRGATGITEGADRSADAIAMSVWPSRGLELHGFEVKVSRGDWLRELREPAKAE